MKGIRAPGDGDVDSTKPERLPHAAAKHLEGEVRRIFPEQSDASIKALLARLDSVICHFCHFERRESGRQIRKIKYELRQLARHVDTLQKFLHGRLSKQALETLDYEISPGFEMPPNFLAAERPFVLKNPYTTATEKKPAKSKLGPTAPQSTYYVAPVVVTLTRLQMAIETALSDKGKDGARFRLAWRDLSWRVALAMQKHLTAKPSATRDGKFEHLFRACLQTGMRAISSKMRIPDDLRPYTRDAINSLTESELSVKPSE